jgi:hypothetical protein
MIKQGWLDADRLPSNAFLALENERRAALIARDVAKLDALLSSHLIHVHASGARDDKAAFLDKVASGTLTFTRIDRESGYIWQQGNVAIITGVMNTTLRRRETGDESGNRTWFTQVWVGTAARAQLVSYHATRVAASQT